MQMSNWTCLAKCINLAACVCCLLWLEKVCRKKRMCTHLKAAWLTVHNESRAGHADAQQVLRKTGLLLLAHHDATVLPINMGVIVGRLRA